MRMLAVVVAPALVLLGACTATALDCARVKALDAEGKRASEIARQLSITTPDVQSCLAGRVDEPPKRTTQQAIPIAPTLPSSDSPLPHPPGQ